MVGLVKGEKLLISYRDEGLPSGSAAPYKCITFLPANASQMLHSVCESMSTYTRKILLKPAFPAPPSVSTTSSRLHLSHIFFVNKDPGFPHTPLSFQTALSFAIRIFSLRVLCLDILGSSCGHFSVLFHYFLHTIDEPGSVS